ncbi:MAG: PIG-L family deacetylase [Anaerolineae bacterium]|nr:PIG-L family deacetylase [Anaerolineae bacterium]
MGNTYIPESAMAIFAHPDDIEFSCAGTLARWAKAGARISYVLCTSGDVGISTPGMTRAEATRIRETEAREAARITGATEIIFLREPDGMLENTRDLRRKLVREIRRFRPEAIICGDPTALWGGDDYINHPDHRAAGWAAVDAAFPAAGQPNLFEELEAEGLKASKVRKVFVVQWEGGSTFVNIDDTIETKVAALKAHVSQVSNLDCDSLLREWAAGAAKGKEMQYAETYRVITLENDEFWKDYIQKNGQA